MKQYVLIEEDHDGGNVFCLGIFDNVYTAVGYAMKRIWEFGESYRKYGDFFEYTPFEELGCECGWYCEVRYKAACWTHMKEPRKDTYFILEHETKEVKHE